MNPTDKIIMLDGIKKLHTALDAIEIAGPSKTDPRVAKLVKTALDEVNEMFFDLVFGSFSLAKFLHVSNVLLKAADAIPEGEGLINKTHEEWLGRAYTIAYAQYKKGLEAV